MPLGIRFLQRPTAMIDSVRLPVCHSLVSFQNDSSYDREVFTGG